MNEVFDESHLREEETRKRVIREVQELLATKVLTHRSPNGTVEVDVDGNGKVKRLTIAPGAIRSCQPAELAGLVMSTINMGRAIAGQRGGKILVTALDSELGA